MAARNGSGFEWSYRDLLIALLVVFVAMAVFAILAAEKQTKSGVRQGMLAIQMTWAMPIDADVDLWVKAPGDRAVGFSHDRDKHCDLVRDDLGRAEDPESRNMEMTICRGADAGEWAVNVMCYHSYDSKFPIPVRVTVTRLGGDGAPFLSRSVELVRDRQQITVFRFRIGSHGRYINGSENYLPMNIYGTPQQ